MSDLENRLRRLERKFVHEPTVAEYLDASNREQVRSLHTLAERLEKYDFVGGHLFTAENRRMLAEDTPEKQERDRETIEAWYKVRGIDRTAEVEGAREKLLAMLETRGRS